MYTQLSAVNTISVKIIYHESVSLLSCTLNPILVEQLYLAV